MKRRTFYFVLLILSISNNLIAQTQSEIIWSEKQELNYAKIDNSIRLDSKGIYVIKESPNTYGTNEATILYYDNNMKLIKSNQLFSKKDKSEYQYQFVVKFNNELCVFTSKLDDSNIGTFYVQTINKETLQLNPNKVKIGSLNYGKIKMFSKSNINSYRISPDGKHILIYVFVNQFDKFDFNYAKNPEKYKLFVLNTSLNIEWTKDITMPYKEELFVIKGINIDNFSNVQVYGSLYEKPYQLPHKSNNFNYKILNYNASSINEYSIDFPNKYVPDFQIISTTENEFLCSGISYNFSDNITSSSFTITIDKLTKKSKEISIKNIQNNNKEVPIRIKYNQFIKLPNNELILIGETTSESIKFFKGLENDFYLREDDMNIYQDIFVIKINSEGVIKWSNVINKHQHADFARFCSYSYLIDNNSVNIFYSDTPKNTLNSTNIPLYSNQNDSEFIMMEIDDAGKKTRKVLFNRKYKEGIIINPQTSYQISENELILWGEYSGNKMQIGKLTIK